MFDWSNARNEKELPVALASSCVLLSSGALTVGQPVVVHGAPAREMSKAVLAGDDWYPVADAYSWQPLATSELARPPNVATPLVRDAVVPLKPAKDVGQPALPAVMLSVTVPVAVVMVFPLPSTARTVTEEAGGFG